MALSEDDLISLEQFEVQNKIEKSFSWRLYQIMNINNGRKSAARVSSFYIKPCLRSNLISFSREVSILSRINFPSITKFNGYSLSNFKNKPKPTIIMDFVPKFTLNKLLSDNIELNDTKKLINLYGIASAMSYLHSHDIIHNDLDTGSIFLDENLYPKLNGFENHIDLQQNASSNKQTHRSDLIKYNDIYAFAFVACQIMNDELFYNKSLKDIEGNYRPPINESVAECYKNLIEKCWSRKAEDRPTFEEIVNELRNNSKFIIKGVDEDEFRNYIKFIDESEKSFSETIKPHPKLDEVIESCISLYNELKIQNKQKDLLFNNTNFDLSKYIQIKYEGEFYPEGIDLLVKKDEKQIKLDEKIRLHFENNNNNNFERFHAQVCPKEINNFYQHEIVNFGRKLSILSQINHPVIMKFIGFSPVDFDNKNRPIIITEFCSSKIDKIFQYSDCTHRLCCFYGIASAMAYLHKHGIIHRDLKPTNIYFNDNNDLPLLYGFDISKRIDDDLESEKHKIKGTPVYLAPEIYMRQEYSKASDVYSFGFLMYVLIYNDHPFIELSDPNKLKHAICEERLRPELKIRSVKAYNNLIERCWSHDIKMRPTFDEIVEELKTNPEFIINDVDAQFYHDYIKYIEEYPTTFDESKRIKYFDEIISSKLHTFNVLEAYPDLENLYDTETNDLSFNHDLFDYSYFSESFFSQTKFYNRKLYIGESGKFMLITPSQTFPEFTAKNISKMKIISQFNHPCILKYIGCDKHNLLFEYLPNLTLYEFLKNDKNTFKDMSKDLEWNETRKLIYFYGIASGMAYLHSHDIIHRDLKPENILLDKQLYPKISGFLIAKKINNKTILKSKKLKGTPAYLAPEVYLNNEYSKSSDVYSFGLIMYEILTGKKPFEIIDSPKGIKKAICEKIRPSIPENISEAYRNLIERCWSQETEMRPTFEEIVNELRMNSSFITDEIEEDEYRKYIQFIDESSISFNPQKLSKYIGNDFNDKDEVTPKINLYDIYQTEIDNILLDYDYIDLQKYKKEKHLYKNRYYKIYKISDKQTGTFYQSKEISGFIEINFFLEANHPTLLKFIGYSPVDFKGRESQIIITEYATNGSLESVLDVDMKKTDEMILNPTKRLIILYGIASGMSYIHSHNLIHGSLNTSNIVLDEFLFPRITEFSQICLLSKNPIPKPEEVFIYDFMSDSIYHSPEYVLSAIKCSANDVYAFAFIAYQLISNEKPFNEKEFNLRFIERIHKQGIRPKFKENVPECYRKLIEKCWAVDPRDRPTFDEIVYHLRTNPEFITQSIDKKEFDLYIKFLDEFQTNKNSIQIEDFIKMEESAFRKVKIDFNKIKNPNRLNFAIGMGSTNLNKYKKIQKIGSGSFGKVYKIIDKETNTLYALKASIYEIDQCKNDIIINLSREIDIISKLNHPSILKFIGFNPRNFKNKPKPIIITEFAPNISLDKIIEEERLGQSNSEWNDTKKLINIYGIASGMAYIHQLDIIHRDLKPGNILLDEFLYPKIADFGLSKTLYDDYEIDINGNRPITSGFKGTYAYSSPEIFDQHLYTKAGDVYAFGMIVYELMTNEILFQEFRNPFKLPIAIVKGYRPKFNFDIPYCYRKLIEKCWSNNYLDRPKFSKIVKILETDPSFITQNVDKEEYFNYISLIKESFSCNNLNENNSNSNKSHSTTKISNTFKIVENEESNEIIECFLNLTKFKRHEIISKNNSSKMYKFIEIETGQLYAGQMSMFKINKISKSDVEKLANELDNISKLNHPCLLKFIGYSPIDFKNQQKPVIVSEYFSNGSLSNLLEIDRTKRPILGWNDTKRLIILYGIASGMSHLHSHGIIHKSLCPSSIYLDDILAPKIGDFGLSTRFDSTENITVQSISGVKVTLCYSAPEVLLDNEYSKASDVYAFGLIAYEILCNEVPFSEIGDNNKIYVEVVINQSRPKIKDNLPGSYRKLIESCWSQSPNERPTFDEIVYKMKNDSGFITDSIEANDYLKYIKFIDGQFDPSSQQKINKHEANSISETSNEAETTNKPGSNDDFEKINKIAADDEAAKNNEAEINDDKDKIKESETNDNVEINDEAAKNNEAEINDHKEKIKESETNDNVEINDDRKARTINKSEVMNASKESKIAAAGEIHLSLIGGQRQPGVKHQESEEMSIELLEDLAINYIRENDTENIYKYLSILVQKGSMSIAFEYALTLYEQKYYRQSFNYFSILSKSNHPIAEYYVGMMKFKGEGCEENKREACKILKRLSERGIDESTEFINEHFLGDK